MFSLGPYLSQMDLRVIITQDKGSPPLVKTLSQCLKLVMARTKPTVIYFQLNLKLINFQFIIASNQHKIAFPEKYAFLRNHRYKTKQNNKHQRGEKKKQILWQTGEKAKIVSVS